MTRLSFFFGMRHWQGGRVRSQVGMGGGGGGEGDSGKSKVERRIALPTFIALLLPFCNYFHSTFH